MWIMTTVGFFSVVQKPEDRGTQYLTVRARVKKDLAILLRKVSPAHAKKKIDDDPRGDYRYRVRLPRKAIAKLVAEAVERIDYVNFKDEIKRVQGPERAQAYSRVWSDLLPLQPGGSKFLPDHAWAAWPPSGGSL
jgi:hypothetical protein